MYALCHAYAMHKDWIIPIKLEGDPLTLRIAF